MGPQMSRLREVLFNPRELQCLIKEWTRLIQRPSLHEVCQNAYCYLYKLPSVDLDSIAPPLDRPFSVIMDHICLPPYYGPSTHDDVTPLMRIIRYVDPKVVLEFGTAHGNTVANICKLCNAYAFTINALPEELSGELTTFTLTKNEIGSVYRQYGFQHRVTQIFTNTLEFNQSHYFEKPCVDVAIIDACHDTEYVINDFLKALPILNIKATVLFHDTHPSRENHLAGSYLACVELRRRGFDIRHLRNTWWAIWEKR